MSVTGNYTQQTITSKVPGPQGPAGPQGEVGPAGPQGPPGESMASQSFAVTGGTVGGVQPTFSGAPLFTGQVATVDNFVHFEIQVDFDNITSFGSGQYYVSLPYAAANPIILRDGCVHDNSNGRQYQISGHAAAGSTQLLLFYASGTGQDEIFDFNSPFNLAVDDNFHVAGSYLKA